MKTTTVSLLITTRTHPLQRVYESTTSSINKTLADPIWADKVNTIRNDIPWILNANSAIKAAQEEARTKKLIGSGLQCSVVLSLPSQESYDIFQRYRDELDSIFVVSKISLHLNIHDSQTSPLIEDTSNDWKFKAEFGTFAGKEKGVAWVLPVKEGKCERCWRYVVKEEAETLCKRCDDIVN